jgi:inorganic pyrophosphatase
MTDFNALLDCGTLPDYINTVIEISQGSILKIEYRRDKGYFELDRVEPGIFAKPCNYGFIPRTLDEDGDELDTLVVCDEKLPMGLVVQAKILGVMNFEDDGEMDHKVICVPLDNRHTGDKIASLDDLGQRWMQQIEHHFTHYKDLKKPGSTKVLGFAGPDEAIKVIEDCVKRFAEQAGK